MYMTNQTKDEQVQGRTADGGGGGGETQLEASREKKYRTIAAWLVRATWHGSKHFCHW